MSASSFMLLSNSVGHFKLRNNKITVNSIYLAHLNRSINPTSPPCKKIKPFKVTHATKIPRRIILSVKYKSRGIHFNIYNYTTQIEQDLDLKDTFTINSIKLTQA